MNKINQGGVKTSRTQVLNEFIKTDIPDASSKPVSKKYDNLLSDHKDIIDVLKNAEYDKSNNDHVEFISSSITVQIEAQLVNCIEDLEYKDIHSNILVSKICSLISSVIEGIVAGDKDVDARSLLYHNIMALFKIYKCNEANYKCKNLMAFINYFCDSFIE